MRRLNVRKLSRNNVRGNRESELNIESDIITILLLQHEVYLYLILMENLQHCTFLDFFCVLYARCDYHTFVSNPFPEVYLATGAKYKDVGHPTGRSFTPQIVKLSKEVIVSWTKWEWSLQQLRSFLFAADLWMKQADLKNLGCTYPTVPQANTTFNVLKVFKMQEV